MASSNYNEVTHSLNPDVNSLDPLYKWDTHFPERLSKLHLHAADNTSPTARRQRQRRNRNTARFKTQPITFDEIKEVDEESNNPTSPETQENIQGIKSEFAAFSRSMDGLLPGDFPRREKTREPSTDSNKENNPGDLSGSGVRSAEAPSGSTVLSVKSPGPPSNTSTGAAPTTTSQTIDPVSGVKIPAGLPSERDAGRARRKPRKKANKGIVEETTEGGDKNGEVQQVG